jgi:catechol 2,3-dioxygenase-like lactoylglutathione lyase family enzyme
MTDHAITVTGINHVVLHVSDIEQSLAFYTGLLGFEERSTGGGGPSRPARFLRCGAQGLDLFEIEDDPHGGVEMNHMALEVDADDVEEVRRRLEGAGVTCSEATRRNSLFINDPDGHRIEMLPRNAHERTRER